MSAPHGSKASATRPPGVAWAAASACAILLATLPPQPAWDGARSQFFDSLLPRGVSDWLDVAQNVALYIPFGLIGAARGGRLLRVGGFAAALSLATELLQYVAPGRSPAARDVVTNTAGALLGLVLLRTPAGRGACRVLTTAEGWLREAVGAQARRAARLSLGWALVVSAIFLVTGALLQPAPPTPLIYALVRPALDDGTGPLRIGGNGSRNGYFKGAIDDVRIFSRPRTAEAIRHDMMRPVRADDTGGSEALVAAYAFDDAQGFAADASAHGHDGRVRGARWTADGRFGGAAVFDGRESRIEIDESAAWNLRDGMTLEAWVQPAADMRGEPAIISRSGNAFYLDIASDNGPRHAAAGGRFGGIPDYARLADAVPAGVWTHLAATFDGQAIRIYVDGALAATTLHWSPHRLVSASLDGRPLAFGPVPDPAAIRRTLLGDIALRAVVACGALDGQEAPVLRLATLRDVDVLQVAASGTELLVRPWTRARSLGLPSPPHRFTAGLDACPPGGEAGLAFDGPLQRLSARRDGIPIAGASAGLDAAWAFVLHAELLPGWFGAVVTVAWLAALAVPFGFWARKAVPSGVGLALLLSSLASGPVLWRVRPPSAQDWSAVGSGLIVGLALARLGASRARGAGEAPGARGRPGR